MDTVNCFIGVYDKMNFHPHYHHYTTSLYHLQFPQYIILLLYLKLSVGKLLCCNECHCAVLTGDSCEMLYEHLCLFYIQYTRAVAIH